MPLLCFSHVYSAPPSWSQAFPALPLWAALRIVLTFSLCSLPSRRETSGNRLQCETAILCSVYPWRKTVLGASYRFSCLQRPLIRFLPFKTPLLSHSHCLLYLLTYFVCFLYGLWYGSDLWALLGNLGLCLLLGFGSKTGWWGKLASTKQLDFLSSQYQAIICPL